MPRLSIRTAIILLAFGPITAGTAAAQAPAASTKLTCTIQQVTETDADRALHRRDYPAAETLYRAQLAAASTEEARTAATAGILRTQLGSGQINEALAAAKKSVADYPKNAVLQDVLGEVYFRRGEPDEAAVTWNESMKLDPCNPRIHYDFARFFRLNGMYASEQAQLDKAHALSPQDNTFRRAAPGVQMTAEDRIARMTERLESGQLSAEERDSLQRSIDVTRAQSKGSCEIVHPVESTKFPIVSIANGPQDMYAAGLELQLNGHKKRFEIDTGASGLLISRSAAASAGIIGEAESRGGGIGDSGPVKELLAHVDSLRIGDLEFHNCLVRVIDKRNVLDVDGLIGPDVFSSWVVTLDIPSREVRLGPLPKRPYDTAQTSELDTAGGGENTQAVPRDRFIAPEMKDWTHIFRYGHALIFLTNIGKTPAKLFIMDTGSSHTIISKAAAKEVTDVGGTNARVRGISGEVKNVSQANDLTIIFGNVGSPLRDILAIDTSGLGRGSGVEVSGLIGFETLRELIISIDYRDNLVHVVYDPKHGFHRR
jgi:tetratricopeptide (TPR) repeat protein